MDWNALTDLNQLESLIDQSFEKPVAVFKHSTTCPISAMAKRRIEQGWPASIQIYYLDLLKYRSISNAVAHQLKVVHESPQLIIIYKGEVVYHASHLNIEMSAVSSISQRS